MRWVLRSSPRTWSGWACAAAIALAGGLDLPESRIQSFSSPSSYTLTRTYARMAQWLLATKSAKFHITAYPTAWHRDSVDRSMREDRYVYGIQEVQSDCNDPVKLQLRGSIWEGKRKKPLQGSGRHWSDWRHTVTWSVFIRKLKISIQSAQSPGLRLKGSKCDMQLPNTRANSVWSIWRVVVVSEQD